MQKTYRRKSILPAKLKISNRQRNEIKNLYDAVVSRASLAGALGQSGYGSNRNIYEALGYLKTITFNDYYARYKRQGIATRIISAMPNACWRKKPTIVEDQRKETEFEKAFNALQKKRKVFQNLKRLDILSGIGQYGVMFMGFDDGAKPEIEVKKASELMFLKPYTEMNAEVMDWEDDTSNERFGMPRLYELTASNADRSGTRPIRAHWSRVIHASESLLEDDVFGNPVLESVYNYLQDLELVTGSIGEIFWRTAYPGLAFNLDPEGDDVNQSLGAMTDEIEKYIHGLKRYLKLQGVEVNNLSPQVPDPTQTVEVLIGMISAAKEIPKRVLMGTERGELASSQDETHWNNKVEERRNDYVEVYLLREMIDRLQMLGVLPEVDYDVEWPDIHAPKEKDVAEVNKIKADTLKIYADSPGSSTVIPTRVFMRDFMKYEDDEIDEIEKMVEDEQAKEEAELEEQRKEFAEQGLDEFGNSIESTEPDNDNPGFEGNKSVKIYRRKTVEA